MRTPLARPSTALFLAALLLGSAPVSGQSAPAPTPEVARALAAVRGCAALGEARQLPQARAAGLEADALLAPLAAREPRNVTLLVARARVASQCLLPAADFPTQAELSGRAVELLEQALELEPRHWVARYVLASIMYRSPSFLGRAARAAREFDTLLEQQGDRADDPMLARPFEYRGILFRRAGDMARAAEVWRRGAALFPLDTALARLAASVTPPPAPAPAADSTRATDDAAVRAPTVLGTVRVAASSAPAASATPLPSVHAVSRSHMLMTAGGAADVLQAVQLQPGATRVTEGSDLHTRGGDPSETAIVVNGGRLLGISRFEGLNGGMFGAIEPAVVRAARYSTGGFSVRHGDALSGVLDIETDGRPRERHLRLGASLVQASGTARVPIGARAGAWASVRAANTGALLATHGRGREFDGAPHSEELVASLIATPTPLTELRATTLLERDDSRRIVNTAGWTGPFHSSGTSRALQLASRWIASAAPVTVRANLTGSSRRSAWEFGALARERDDASLRGRLDAEWLRSPAVTVRAGVEHAALGRTESGTLPTTSSVAPGAPTRTADGGRADARHAGGWLETEVGRGASTVTLGLRADRLPGERAVTLDPRLAVSTRTGAWTARASAGLFHQGRFRAAPAIPDGGTPSGAARVARHLVAGVEREGVTTTLRAEAFDKRYGAYVPLGAGPAIASARSRGLDVVAQRTAGGRVTGWIGWSLLDATVLLEDGRRARSPFDVTHSATASATWALDRDWSVGSTVRYGTGAPTTPITGGEVRADGRTVPVYGAASSERLPSYGRLDLRVMRFIRTPGALVTTYMEALNVTDRANVASMAYDADYRTRRPVHAFFATRTIVVGGEVQLR